MPQIASPPADALLASSRGRRPSGRRGSAGAAQPRGFGAGRTAARGSAGQTSSRRKSALTKADWGPLGKHPDREAILARQRLHLPLSGRLGVAQVNQAWKRCAGVHHPDRGGAHDRMQLVNGARDLLLGRDRA